MKKNYITPDLQVYRIHVSDVIATSTGLDKNTSFGGEENFGAPDRYGDFYDDEYNDNN